MEKNELTPLNHVFLACNQPWENMEQQPTGRLCGGCNKVLVDFSEFTDDEIKRHHLLNGPGICGKYTAKQVMAMEGGNRPPMAQRSGWLVAMLMGALAISPLMTAAQDTSSINIPIQLSPPLPGVPGDLQYPLLRKENPTAETIKIKGRVTDESGEGVYYAIISIENTDIASSTNFEGYYSLELPISMLKETITIKATCLGYLITKLPKAKIEAPETIVDIKISVGPLQIVGLYVPSVYQETHPGQTTFHDPFNWGNGSKR